MSSPNSPLISYALNGLSRCWLPDAGRWSHIYHLDGRQPANESRPRSDVFYTLNVLLGLSRVSHVPENVRIADIFEANVRQLPTLPVREYAYGMALWVAGEARLDVPPPIADHVRGVLSDAGKWRSLRAQDVGMLLTGVVAQARIDPAKWSSIADRVFSRIESDYAWPSGLFGDAPSGLRRRFASFASQVYLTLACYSYGELSGNPRAIELANKCSRKLIALQGPQGEWPWFFDAQAGRVVDFYEVYSVHQYGMAPAFLEFSQRHGVGEARTALIKGFKWVLGANQLAKPMLAPALSLSIRSQVRKGELRSDKWRALRAVANAAIGHSPGLIAAPNLELRLECRSYELGWILWSFGRVKDLPELTDNALFMSR